MNKKVCDTETPPPTATRGGVHIGAARPVGVERVFYPGQAPANAPDPSPFPTPAIPYRRYPYPDVGRHNHDFHEVVFVLSGQATHVVHGTRRPVEGGTVIVVPPRITHAFAEVRHLAKINLYYIAEWLGSGLAELWEEPGFVPLFVGATILPSERHPAPQVLLPETVFARVRDELNDVALALQGAAPSLLYLRAALLKVLVLVSRSYVCTREALAASPYRPEVWAALHEIEKAVEQGRPVQVEELAQRVGFTREHFARVFREGAGLSPRAYYQKRRAQQAARLLLNPETGVTEVAHRLGYSDASHLARLFRRYHGLSPRAYQARFHGHSAIEHPESE